MPHRAFGLRRQVDLKTPWHFERVEIMPPWCHYSPRFLGTKLACMQVLAWGGITCTSGGATMACQPRLKQFKAIEPHRYPACACVWSTHKRKGHSEKLLHVMSV